jgi:hypothetical protein
MAALPHIPIIQAQNVPYGAGMDAAGSRVYIDPEFPRQGALHTGKLIDTIPPTAIHEITETRYLQQGVKYAPAHKYANEVEVAYLRHQGLTDPEIKEYEDRLRPNIREVRRWTGPPPEDLNPKPYEDEGEMHLLRPPKQHPYADTAFPRT